MFSVLVICSAQISFRDFSIYKPDEEIAMTKKKCNKTDDKGQERRNNYILLKKLDAMETLFLFPSNLKLVPSI